MHDIKAIRDDPDAFDQALARRGLPPESKRLLALDERRRAAIAKAEQAQARRNAASKEIGVAKKNKDEEKTASSAFDSNDRFDAAKSNDDDQNTAPPQSVSRG